MFKSQENDANSEFDQIPMLDDHNTTDVKVSTLCGYFPEKGK